MKATASPLPRTTSPGITVQPPMRVGQFMPVSMIVGAAIDGCQPRTKQAKSSRPRIPSMSRTELSWTTPFPDFALMEAARLSPMIAPLSILPKTSCDVHVPCHQHVDRPVDVVPLVAPLLTLLVEGAPAVGAPRHEGGRHRAPAQHLPRVGVGEPPFELELVAGAVAGAPGLGQGDVPHALDDFVRHARAAVGEALPLPVGGVLDQVLPGEAADRAAFVDVDGHYSCFSSLKPTAEWEPSQNGLFFEAPQRHRA